MEYTVPRHRVEVPLPPSQRPSCHSPTEVRDELLSRAARFVVRHLAPMRSLPTTRQRMDRQAPAVSACTSDRPATDVRTRSPITMHRQFDAPWRAEQRPLKPCASVLAPSQCPTLTAQRGLAHPRNPVASPRNSPPAVNMPARRRSRSQTHTAGSRPDCHVPRGIPSELYGIATLP